MENRFEQQQPMTILTVMGNSSHLIYVFRGSIMMLSRDYTIITSGITTRRLVDISLVTLLV